MDSVARAVVALENEAWGDVREAVAIQASAAAKSWEDGILFYSLLCVYECC